MAKDKRAKELARRKKLAERQVKRQPPPKKHENHPCVECGQPCLLSDMFIVKNATWAEAGLNGWNAGHLHLACFKKRLKRDLREEELLVWNVGGSRFQIRPEYAKSPEFLEHGRTPTPS